MILHGAGTPDRRGTDSKGGWREKVVEYEGKRSFVRRFFKKASKREDQRFGCNASGAFLQRALKVPRKKTGGGVGAMKREHHGGKNSVYVTITFHWVRKKAECYRVVMGRELDSLLGKGTAKERKKGSRVDWAYYTPRAGRNRYARKGTQIFSLGNEKEIVSPEV